MQIIVTMLGGMGNYFPWSNLQISLAEGAVLADFFLCLESQLDPERGKNCWDFDSHAFRGPVIVMIDGEIVRDKQTPLADGQNISIMRFLTGG